MGLVESLKRELNEVPDFVLRKIDRTAKKYNFFSNFCRDKKIQAIYFHPDPESGKGIFYLITEGKYSRRLSDKFINLELEVMKKKGVDVGFQDWPCGYEGIEDYGFFKEFCICDYTKAA
ncbi:unnamed protein product [marine sediment metagenome]|uniref:Uncharacterized protein n=1 Tax=marine sediment metagenome TaxID=412755 RepID=X0TEQ5_9ZZZZ